MKEKIIDMVWNRIKELYQEQDKCCCKYIKLEIQSRIEELKQIIVNIQLDK